MVSHEKATTSKIVTYLGGFVLEGDDTTFNHFVVQIVTLTGSLADTGEDGVTTVGLGDVVDQLHDKHSLADTGTTEETNLTTLRVGSQQVDDLNAGDQDFGFDTHLHEFGSLGVDGGILVGVDWSTV